MATPAPPPPHLPLEPDAWRLVLIGLRCAQVALVGFAGPIWLMALLAFRGAVFFFEAPLLPWQTAHIVVVVAHAILIVVFGAGLALQGWAPAELTGRRYAQAALALTMSGFVLAAFAFLLICFPSVLIELDGVIRLEILHKIYVLMLALNSFLAGAMSLWFLRSVGAWCGRPLLVNGAAGCTKWLGVLTATAVAALWLPRGPEAANRALLALYWLWLIGLAPVVYVWWQVLLHEAARCLSQRPSTSMEQTTKNL